MIRIDVPALGSEEFSIGPVEGVLPAVRFTGTGDMEAATEPSQFLNLLHDAVMRLEAKSLVFDITERYFMNYSCLKELVVWIKRSTLTAAPTRCPSSPIHPHGRPYTVSFVTKPRLKWQSRSLSTLQRLAPAVIQLELTGSAP